MKVRPRPLSLNLKAGFTLVELLVVIGIIALLISILLPALNKVRAQAQITACLSNLRQVGNAFVMYTIENKGWMPYPTTASALNVPVWFDALPPYVAAKAGINRTGAAQYRSYARIFQDPVWDTFPEKTNGTAQGFIKESNRTYKMNTHLRLAGGQSARITNVRKGSEFILIGDSTAYDLIPLDSNPGGGAVSQNGRFSMQISESDDSNDAWVFLRHRNTANICFVDGHAANCNFKLTPKGTAPDGVTPLPWDAPANVLAAGLNQQARMWYSEYVDTSGKPVWPLPALKGKSLEALGLRRNPDMPIQWTQPPLLSRR
jgi:prepilin-type N-terminal cleavage/methylation domain-containing protein/prepilin-type processing-associated H-X9-DG protein